MSRYQINRPICRAVPTSAVLREFAEAMKRKTTRRARADAIVINSMSPRFPVARLDTLEILFSFALKDHTSLAALLDGAMRLPWDKPPCAVSVPTIRLIQTDEPAIWSGLPKWTPIRCPGSRDDEGSDLQRFALWSGAAPSARRILEARGFEILSILMEIRVSIIRTLSKIPFPHLSTRYHRRPSARAAGSGKVARA